MPESKEAIKEYIKKEIAKSGFPLEIRIATLLDQNGWSVTPHIIYPLDGKNNREIDIQAKKEHHHLDNAQNVLIVECKKQENKPWVFFQQDKTNRNVYCLNLSPLHMYEQIKTHLLKEHYYFNKKPCAYHFPSFVKKGNPDQILEAINQVLNALTYTFERELKFYEEIQNKTISFFYPVIVLDGQLFSAQVNSDGSIEPTESEYLQLKVTKALKEPMEIEGKHASVVLSLKPFVIDIVTKDYFQEFLKVFS